MGNKPKLHGITFNEKVGQLNYYPPEDLLRVLMEISNHRPKYENNARVRSKKEAIYTHFLTKAKLERFFNSNISYCGLTSVFFDRIFLMAYPLISKAVVYENDKKMIDRVGWQIQNMMKAGLSDFINGIEFKADTVFNLPSHGDNKYGWIDLDFNQTTSYEGCKGVVEVINQCADDRCLVSIWNAIGMKHLKFEEQQGMTNEVIVDELKERFVVLDDEEITYEDTALMYVRILKLRRK